MKNYIIFILFTLISFSNVDFTSEEEKEAYFIRNGYQFPWEVEESKTNKDSLIALYYLRLSQVFQPFEADSIIFYNDRAKDLIDENNLSSLLPQYYVVKAGFFTQNQELIKAVELYKNAEIYSLEEKDTSSLAITYSNLSSIGTFIDYQEMALDYFNKAIKLNIKIGREFNNINLWQNLTMYQLRNGDSLNAKQSASKIFESAVNSKNYIWEPYGKNTYAQALIELGELDSAKSILKNLLPIADTIYYQRIPLYVYQNYAKVLLKQGQLDSALLFVNKADSVNNSGTEAINNQIKLLKADILLKKGDKSKVKELISNLDLENGDILYTPFYLEANKILYDVYKEEEQLEKLLTTTAVIDSIDKAIKSQEGDRNLKILEIKLLLKQKEIEAENLNKILALEKANSKKTVYIFSSLAIIILLLALVLLMNINRKKNILIEKKKVMELEKISLNQLLNHKEESLKENMKLLSEEIEKNIKLEEKLEESLKSAKENLTLNDIVKLVKNDTNNKDHWQQFEVKFLEIYPNFFQNLKSKCTELSTSELKVLAFVKMNFNSKEIANILNLEPPTIDRHRSNARKKMGLKKGEDLLSFLIEIL